MGYEFLRFPLNYAILSFSPNNGHYQYRAEQLPGAFIPTDPSALRTGEQGLCNTPLHSGRELG